MVIRDACILDLPALTDIYNQAVVSTTATFDLEPLTLEQRREWFSHYGNRHPLIVGEIQDCVIGYCSLSPYREKRGYSRTVEISVYVDAAFRGQGVGRSLVQEALRRALDLGYHVVIAGISGGNEASVRLHTAFGFQQVGHLREVGYKFDQWQDVDFFELVLA